MVGRVHEVRADADARLSRERCEGNTRCGSRGLGPGGPGGPVAVRTWRFVWRAGPRTQALPTVTTALLVVTYTSSDVCGFL